MTWQDELATAVGARVVAAEPVSGGDINEAFRVRLADERVVFVKTRGTPLPGMFVAEAAGLEWLRAGPLRVPRVIAVTEALLALEWLELDHVVDNAAFGRGLASLHRLGAPSFGLERGTYLATIPQDNTPEPDVATHWIERRLRPLCTRARLDVDRQLDALARQPERFGPPEPPSRLHGDLWWGNVGSSDGVPVVFDPAVYGGHREVDLAMLSLFGGLPQGFVVAYEEVWPLAAGWHARIPLWQLYPLAAHAVLFGGGYKVRVQRLLHALA